MSDVDEMHICALLPYFGSKRTLTPVIVEELGEHRAYFEVFCGSMAVLLAKPRAPMENVVDLNGDLVNLARVIQDRKFGPLFYRRCRRLMMTETTFREAAERWKSRGRQSADEVLDVERAVDYFYTSWVGRNGVTGTKSYNQGFAARYTVGGGHGGTRLSSAVSSILAFRNRLRDVTVLCRCGFAVLEKIADEPGACVYADPPYVVKGAEYVHDATARPASVEVTEWIEYLQIGKEFPDLPAERVAWHAALANRLSRFRKARVVVSYYRHPLVDRLYRGWTFRDCPVPKSMLQGNARGRGMVEAPEVLIINGKSNAAPKGYSLFAMGAA